MGCAFCHGSGRLGSTVRQPTSFVRLSLGATRDFTVSFVSPRERERRQPGFATDGPEFVGRNQLVGCIQGPEVHFALRSEEHTSELQSLMRISYAVFGLKKK